MHILILNGPNLNLLGLREPGVYGQNSYEEVCSFVRRKAAELGAEVAFAQSNSEGALIDHLHSAMGVYDGIVLNAGPTPIPATRSGTLLRLSGFRWWRCICPTSTQERSSGIRQ